eukprot:TRINITY_DN68014_c5_g1_i2.p1 TRINITY_DN68014_c5_g1~~TRINITY_DN68014_c5_g1_i2.p1  ORF type:complete len:675 (-),score=7.92 TRINITY_DN68014_c5_g1_i2:40-2064(-)
MAAQHQGLVLGIIIGSVAFLLIVVVFAAIFLIRSRQSREKSHRKQRSRRTERTGSRSSYQEETNFSDVTREKEERPQPTSSPTPPQAAQPPPSQVRRESKSDAQHLVSSQSSVPSLSSSTHEQPQEKPQLPHRRPANQPHSPDPPLDLQSQSSVSPFLCQNGSTNFVHTSSSLIHSTSQVLTDSVGSTKSEAVRAAAPSQTPRSSDKPDKSQTSPTEPVDKGEPKESASLRRNSSSAFPRTESSSTADFREPAKGLPMRAGSISNAANTAPVNPSTAALSAAAKRGAGGRKGVASVDVGAQGGLLGQTPMSELKYTPVEGHFQKLPDLLGQGSFGCVWKGRNEETGELVALKQISDVAAAIQNELDTMLSVQHPNIVRCYGMHQQENEQNGDTDVFLVMEYLAQGSLSHLQKTLGPLPYPLFLKVAKETLQAVSYLHDRGLIHRDIKPGNILMGIDGSIKLSDFGTARSFGTLTETATVAGTLLYMAPEAGAGILTPASDIWSLGVTFLELLTGQLPWVDLVCGGLNAMQIFFKVYHDGVTLQIPDEVPDGFRDLILACCTRDHKTRPTVHKLLEHPGLQQTYPFKKLDPPKKIAHLSHNHHHRPHTHNKQQKEDSPTVTSYTQSYDDELGESTIKLCKNLGWSFAKRSVGGGQSAAAPAAGGTGSTVGPPAGP